jgi:hypothetical protein
MLTTWEITGPEILIGRHLLPHGGKTSSTKVAAFDLVSLQYVAISTFIRIDILGCNFGSDQVREVHRSRSA